MFRGGGLAANLWGGIRWGVMRWGREQVGRVDKDALIWNKAVRCRGEQSGVLGVQGGDSRGEIVEAEGEGAANGGGQCLTQGFTKAVDLRRDGGSSGAEGIERGSVAD